MAVQPVKNPGCSPGRTPPGRTPPGRTPPGRTYSLVTPPSGSISGMVGVLSVIRQNSCGDFLQTASVTTLKPLLSDRY